MEKETINGPSPVHPFDNPELREYVSETFPQHIEAMISANRPSLSSQPDELERWEADKIVARKQLKAYEDPKLYLRRLLYEETFSVNQNPGSVPEVLFQGVAGMTPGGLISHFAPRYISSGVSLEKILTMSEINAPSLGEAINQAKMRDHKDAYNLAEMISIIMQPDIFNAYRTPFLSRHILAGSINPVHDNLAFRMLKMFKAAPEMLEHVEDNELQAKFSRGAGNLSRANLVVRAWEESQVILPDGFYTGSDAPEVQTAVDNLFALRTHSEMQIFFKYLSPSGYINESKGTA